MRCAILAFLCGACWLQTCSPLPTWNELAAAAGIAVLLCMLRRRASLLLTAMLLGASWASICAHLALEDALPREQEGVDVAIVGTVDSLPHTFEGGTRFHFRVERVLSPAATVPGRVALSWYGRNEAPGASALPEPGERWQLVVRLQRPHGNANPIGTG